MGSKGNFRALRNALVTRGICARADALSSAQTVGSGGRFPSASVNAEDKGTDLLDVNLEGPLATKGERDFWSSVSRRTLLGYNGVNLREQCLDDGELLTAEPTNRSSSNSVAFQCLFIDV